MKTFLFLLATLALPAAADTLYSNLGDPATYLKNGGITIATSDTLGDTLAQGFRFTSAATGSLGQVDLGLGYISTNNGTVTVSLWSDGGSTVGSLLGSWDATAAVRFGTSDNVLTTFTTPGGPTLTAGTNYILTMSPRGTGVWAAWNHTSTNAAKFLSRNDAPWSTNGSGVVGAVRLLSAAPPPPPVGVPEPSSVLTLAGVLLFAVRRRSSHRS